MVVFKSKKEMVAGTHHHYFITHRFISIGSQQLFCQFICLYPFLMKASREKQLEAALAFVLILLIISLGTGYTPLISYAIIVGFLLGAFPMLLRYFYFGWANLLKAINFVTSKVLLAIIFIVFIVPLSFFVRRSKKRTMVLKKGNRTSLFTDRNHLFTNEELKNPW
jgi:hypothetical protein